MKRFISTAVIVLSVALLSACAKPENPFRAAPAADSQLEFIDLETFDISMTRDLRSSTDLVVVRFPNQPITINEMPERLQKWLVAAHKHGQGLTVERTDGYEQKDLITLVGVLVSGYKLVQENMPSIVSRKYKAVITLDNANGVIDKVEFRRL